MKKINIILRVMICLTINTLKVNASGGRLRINSIKICNGVTYGQHSSDNHWHIAEKKDGIYYATGDAIYNNPCSTTVTSSSSTNTSNDQVNNNTKNNSNNTNTSTNVSNSSKPITSTNKTTTTKKTNLNTQNNTVVKNNNTKAKQEKVVVRSDDNTLKTIIINGTSIGIKDIINYSTTKDNVEIKVETNNEKASYEIKNNNLLKNGKNEITIEVKSESGKIKIYQIIVNKEKIQSSNVGIDVTINDQKIIFAGFKSKIYISSSTDKIDVNYTLKDSKSKVVMSNIDIVKTGSNILNIKVTAEDGTTQEYEVDIYKYSSTEEFIYGVLGFAMLGGVGYGFYRLVKKIKK